MLTSHHSLLSGIAAVLCATGMVYQSIPEGPTKRLQQATVAQPAPAKTVDVSSIDISYRGSGRIDKEPIESDYTETDGEKLAHRGSGRVVPQSL